MKHPFFVWYFHLYQFNTEIWLKAMSSVGRYPAAQDPARDPASPAGR
ncbi:MAG: hypothetical protein WC100_20650 [Sterolibacterium sp.]